MMRSSKIHRNASIFNINKFCSFHTSILIEMKRFVRETWFAYSSQMVNLFSHWLVYAGEFLLHELGIQRFLSQEMIWLPIQTEELQDCTSCYKVSLVIHSYHFFFKKTQTLKQVQSRLLSHSIGRRDARSTSSCRDTEKSGRVFETDWALEVCKHSMGWRN